MKRSIQKIILTFILFTGSLISILRGAGARQKWVFKMKSKIAEKEQQADNQKMFKKTGIMLDEVELAAFHRIS